MSMRIAEAIGVVVEVLEKNHPDAIVKSSEPGESDFRVGSVGASISVSAEENRMEVTDEDVEMILELAEERIDNRHLVFEESKGTLSDVNGKTVWFDLKS